MNARLASSLTTLLLVSAAPAATLTGYWEFGNPANLGEATVGSDLTLGGTHTHHPSLSDGTTTLAGAITTEGNSTGSFLTANPNIPANGGGAFVNQYSIVVDLFSPAGSQDSWRAIYQTNAAPDGNDADYWISPDNNLGVGDIGYSTGTIEQSMWNRLVVTVDLALDGPDVNSYLNGSLFYAHPNGSGVDGRFSLYPIDDTNVMHFFGDNTAGENPPMNIGAIAIYDGVLSAAEVAGLGGPGGAVPEPSSALLLSLAAACGLRRRRRN